MERWGGMGSRRLPFSSRQPPTTDDDDLSYITSQDFAQPSRKYTSYSGSVAQPEDDVLLVKNKGITYPIKFPAYSIGDGKLQIRDVRIRAAAIMDLPDPARLKLLYKGQQLKDDSRPCREYNVKNMSEILCIVGEAVREPPEDSDEGYKSKSTSRRKASNIGGASSDFEYTDSGYGTNNPPSDAAYPKRQKRDPIPRLERPRYTTPDPDDVRRSALAKLEAISTHFHTKLLPLCVQFTSSPPADPKEKDLERMKLEGAIMNEVLLKLDAVETEGDPEVWEKRSVLVSEAQSVLLNGLEDSATLEYDLPPIPKTLVSRMDPAIAQEFVDKIYAEKGASASHPARNTPRGTYDLPQYQGVPSGTDSYSALNPNKNSVSTPLSARYVSNASNPDVKIITHDGREIDPSDPIPESRFSPLQNDIPGTKATESIPHQGADVQDVVTRTCEEGHLHSWPTSGKHKLVIQNCETQCGWCDYATVGRAVNLRVHARRHLQDSTDGSLRGITIERPPGPFHFDIPGTNLTESIPPMGSKSFNDRGGYQFGATSMSTRGNFQLGKVESVGDMDNVNAQLSSIGIDLEDEGTAKLSEVERIDEIPKAYPINLGVANIPTDEFDGSDLESLPSIDDEIFSTSGSISTNSTVSSIRFTVIEIIVGRFIEDEELACLYVDAMKRMGNARFVRNQKRLLKRFFLDLRPQAQTPLQQQAIKILRGRAERMSIAEQIWSTISPSNPSKEADMAALKTQKVDKKSQLERLLRPRPGGDTSAPEEDTISHASEESDGSDSESSNFAETTYPNVELAAEFLVGGDPYKKYKHNFRNFLHLDSGAWGPVTLHEYVVKGDVGAVTKLLEEHFDDVARLEFDWLHELLDIGCMYEEIARLLIDGENGSPWILLDHRSSVTSTPIMGFHQQNCVHSGGQRLDTTPRIITSQSLQIQERSVIPTVQETICELCGIGGALPLSSNIPGVDLEIYDWILRVHFSGGDNSIACIGYASDIHQVAPNASSPVLRMVDALQRAINAIGFLQENGLCCDAFTILRLLETRSGSSYIELCNVSIISLEQMRSALETWTRDTTNIINLDLCAMSASGILNVFCGGPPYVPFSASPLTVLHLCALAVQCVTVGILSYSQGHSGPLHPCYLVDDLKELHLLGNALEPENSAPSHVLVKLLDFTCLKGMVQNSVLVFIPSAHEDNIPKFQAGFDLLASPEDLAVTWAPARFIAEHSKLKDYSHLIAIEIGGGTVTRADHHTDKLHWSPGSKSYDNCMWTFNSKDKVLIGGTTINDKCPLDEAESWRNPATNAYLRHLGTHESSWELRELQAGLQGGQYAVLAFNSTFVKQPGVTLKQQQLMLPSNEIDLAFLNSTCGLQISFCTGVARRVALRELLADVMTPFVESRVSKPVHWQELKKLDIIENFKKDGLDVWFDTLTPPLRETAIHIVRSMLEILKDTGIDKNGEELVIAWVRKDSPYSCLRLRCEKTSLWARILADSEDCATFACITPLCFEIEKHKCRGLKVAPWHNVTNLLDTAVCPQLSNREITTVTDTIASWKLQHQVSYWIGKSGSNLIAKVWLTNEDSEPRLVIRQKVIPEKYRSRLPKAMVDRLGRLRERQASETFAKQVVILAEI